MKGREAGLQRFADMVLGATDGYRMLAVCVIGRALDDIGPRGEGRPTPLPRPCGVPEEARDALAWIAGQPARFPANLACTLAGIPPDILRSEARQRLVGQGWQMADTLATVAA